MSNHRHTRVAPAPSGTPDSAPARSAWLRLGFEQAESLERCPTGDCTDDTSRPTDLYCRVHSRFLPYSTDDPSKTRRFVVGLLRAAVLATFSLSAQLDTAIPLDVLGAFIGLALVALPLRQYRTNGPAVVLLWLLACAVRLLLLIHSTGFHKVVGTTLVAVFLLIAMWYLGELCAKYAVADVAYVHGVRSRLDEIENSGPLARRATGRATGVVAAAAAITPGALLMLAAMANGPDGWIARAPHGLRSWLLWAGVGGLLGTLFAAVVAGFLHGSPGVNTHFESRITLPTRPATITPSFTRANPRATVIDQLFYQLDLASRRAAAALVNLLRSAAYLAAVTLLRTAIWVQRQAVIMGRRIRATVVCAAQILRDAAVVYRVALGHTIRVLMIPVAAVAAAVGIITPTGQWLRLYLVAGQLSDLGGGLAGLAVLMVFTCVAWMALSGLSFADALNSAWFNVQVTIVQAMVLTAIGGTVVGLPGTLGHGRIHIGVLTIGLDVLLVLFYVQSRWRERHNNQHFTPEEPANVPRDAVPGSPSSGFTGGSRV